MQAQLLLRNVKLPPCRRLPDGQLCHPSLKRSTCPRLKARLNILRASPSPDSSSGSGLDPKLEVAVPADQRPVNELAQLRNGQLYSWATLELRQYAKRLGLVWLAIFTAVSGPIAYQTFDPSQQPIEWAVAGCLGSLMVVALVVLRIYLGWAYVGDRLLSAAVPYEETGWYDGQTFVKPPEVLARDRLLGSYEVKPKLALLKRTLLGTGGALAACAIVLLGLARTGTEADGMIVRGAARIPRQITGEGLVFSQKVQHLQDLLDDDELAAKEATAQGGVPGYCSDRETESERRAADLLLSDSRGNKEMENLEYLEF